MINILYKANAFVINILHKANAYVIHKAKACVLKKLYVAGDVEYTHDHKFSQWLYIISRVYNSKEYTALLMIV